MIRRLGGVHVDRGRVTLCSRHARAHQARATGKISGAKRATSNPTATGNEKRRTPHAAPVAVRPLPSPPFPSPPFADAGKRISGKRESFPHPARIPRAGPCPPRHCSSGRRRRRIRPFPLAGARPYQQRERRSARLLPPPPWLSSLGFSPHLPPLLTWFLLSSTERLLQNCACNGWVFRLSLH